MGFFGGYFGGGGGDTTAPTITLISPITFNATYSVARVEPVIIDVVDILPGVEYITVLAKLPGEAYHLVIQGNPVSAVFESEYDADSAVTVITNGFRLSILPDARWVAGTLSIMVVAIDGDGNGLSSTLTWTINSAPETDTGQDIRDGVWRWRRRLNKQKCSVISIAIDDNYSSGPGFTLVALALEIGKKSGLDRAPWRGGTNTNTSGSGDIDNGR